jgi:hypothetical protein
VDVKLVLEKEKLKSPLLSNNQRLSTQLKSIAGEKMAKLGERRCKWGSFLKPR